MDWDYRNKTILAPMVRVGTLPMRLLAHRYGCDITYGEEIIDLAMREASIQVDEALATVNVVQKNGKVIWSTNEEDRPHTVFQIGSANAVTCLHGASLVAPYVRAIDLNMGCPQHFSISGGMGAALLNKPEVVKDILSTLVRNLDVPITCKIRLKPKLSDTIDLLKLVESTGIKAVTIHTRYVPERPQHPAHWDLLKELIGLNPINIPIIANGDIFRYSDIQKCRDETGVSSVMIARAASHNPSLIFHENPKSQYEVMQDYMKVCCEVDNPWPNTKYNLLLLSKGVTTGDGANFINNTSLGKLLHRGKTMAAGAEGLGVTAFYEESVLKLHEERERIMAAGSSFESPLNLLYPGLDQKTRATLIQGRNSTMLKRKVRPYEVSAKELINSKRAKVSVSAGSPAVAVTSAAPAPAPPTNSAAAAAAAVTEKASS
eukprot:TRINITY_DN300_c1_g1_i1.p1 TRINITY_DN300_c1_g1~~TRINITY_DN300_c1_g1_i1.p1  ORF type:complete len:477 (-),score=109.31 TRINITY_DN300_c1_g1_i1:64-1359(-)